MLICFQRDVTDHVAGGHICMIPAAELWVDAAGIASFKAAALPHLLFSAASTTLQPLSLPTFQKDAMRFKRILTLACIGDVNPLLLASIQLVLSL